ncbi:hypothetical protein MMC17_005430 [Xylographa soralifera]|nr:hypothetical protein [Xylographa soralifera]
MADASVASFAEFQKVGNDIFNPAFNTTESLDSFLNNNFDRDDLSRTVFETTVKAIWNTSAVYSAETSYLQLCEELRRRLCSCFRQIGLILHHTTTTRHISGSVLFCFTIELLCTLAQLFSAQCCGRTVKEDCLDITFSERNTPEVDEAIAAEFQAIYNHIMDVEQDTGRNSRLEDKMRCLEALLTQHDRSWIGFTSKILQNHEGQLYSFQRDLASGAQMMVCEICMDHIPKSQFPGSKITDRCDHTTTACMKCLSHSLSSQLDMKSWDRLACLICPVVLEFKEVEMYGSKDMTARYQRFMIAETFKDDPEYRPCLRPGCNFGQLHEEGEKAPLIRCGDCGYRMCYVHNIPWHENQTCGEHDYHLDRGDEKKREEEASQAMVANAAMNSVGNALHHTQEYVIVEMTNIVGSVPITAPIFRKKVPLYGHSDGLARTQN